MTASSPQVVESALAGLSAPWLDQGSLLQVADIESIQDHGDRTEVALKLAFSTDYAAAAEQIQQQLQAQGINAEVKVTGEVQPAPRSNPEHGLKGVKNIIAVASGKGGVGKSTTAVNLALALQADGARVGILDADIYGPSIGKMLGVAEDQRPGMEQVGQQQMFVPVESLGLKSNSMAYLVTEETPVAWRGPMASGALLQLLGQTMWGELDYLVVDMPPGTGDIQLTLSQKAAVAGSVIVTTPQDLALLDARKGLEMFRKVEVPVLGIIENMAVHVCSSCGHAEHLFGEGGGRRMAEQYDTSLLGSLPLSLSIREQADSGQPSVAADIDSAEAQLYRDTARNMAARLALQNRQAAPIPTITMSDD